MSVLFIEHFDHHPITVLEVRGRPAFLPFELAVAAGYAEAGKRFVDQIFREWAQSLDEDDDIAQLVGGELAAIKREVPAFADASVGIVLFPTGAERCLRRSHARRARELVTFIHGTLLPRFVQLTLGEVTPTARPAGSTSLAKAMEGERERTRKAAIRVAFAKLGRLGVKFRKVDEQKEGYRELVHLADALREDHVVTHEEWGALRVEAIEHLLGRSLRTRLALADLFLPIPATHA
jgi:hypothetical protein